MKKILAVLIILSLQTSSFCTFFAHAEEIVAEDYIYVSTTGSDENAGTEDSPVKTLSKAAELYASAKADGKLPVISMSGGIYQMGNTLKLNASHSGMKIIAADGADVRVTGTEPVTGFSKVENSEMFRSEASDKVYVAPVPASLSGKNLTVSNWLWTDREDVVSPFELYLNGNPQTIARWPNSGWAYTQGALNRSFKTTGDIDKWTTSDTRVCGYFSLEYAFQMMSVSSFATDTSRIILTGPPDGSLSSNSRYYVNNTPWELDAPGEYYIDAEDKKIYYYPQSADDLQNLEITVCTGNLIEIDGGDDDVAENITIQGITLDGVTGNIIKANNCKNINIKSCEIKNSGKYGLYFGVSGETKDNPSLVKKVDNCSIISCEIYNTGSGGVYLNGGRQSTLTAGNNEVKNCNIYNVDRYYRTYGAGVNVRGVGNKVTNCNIYSAPHSAVIVEGNDNEITNNIIYDVNKETADVGAVYCSGNTFTYAGNKIENNIFANIYNHKWNAAYDDLACIYADDFASFLTIKNNVFYDCSRPIKIGGGRNVTIENNLIYNNSAGIYYEERGTASATYKKMVIPEGTVYGHTNALRRAEGYDENKWKEYDGFAELLNDMEAVSEKKPSDVTADYIPKTGISKGTKVKNNVFWGRGAEADSYCTLYDRLKKNEDSCVYSGNLYKSSGDIKFKDADNLDFRLNDSSPALGSGFTNIDCSNIGNGGVTLSTINLKNSEDIETDFSLTEDFEGYEEGTNAAETKLDAMYSSKTRTMEASVATCSKSASKALSLVTAAFENGNDVMELKFPAIKTKDRKITIAYDFYGSNCNRRFSNLMTPKGFNLDDVNYSVALPAIISRHNNTNKNLLVGNTILADEDDYTADYIRITTEVDYNGKTVEIYINDDKESKISIVSVDIPEYIDTLATVMFTDTTYVDSANDKGIYMFDNFEITSEYIGDKTSFNAVPEDGKLNITGSFNGNIANGDYIVLLGIYDGTELISAKMIDSGSLSLNGENVNVNKTADISEVRSGKYNLKIFLWRKYDNCIPLTDEYHIDNITIVRSGA